MAKYFVVPYGSGALIVRASQERPLRKAIDLEGDTGVVPTGLARTGYQTIPVDSIEQAFSVSGSHGVTEPDLHRLDANGRLQPISFGSKDVQANPRRKNTHDEDSSTDDMLATMWHGVRAFERAGRTKKENDRRAALATAQWELGQAWTHGQYAALSAEDKADTRVWLYELAMRVHELIADNGRPSLAEIHNNNETAERLAEFVEKSRFTMRVANPRRRSR